MSNAPGLRSMASVIAVYKGAVAELEVCVPHTRASVCPPRALLHNCMDRSRGAGC